MYSGMSCKISNDVLRVIKRPAKQHRSSQTAERELNAFVFASHITWKFTLSCLIIDPGELATGIEIDVTPGRAGKRSFC